jgi:uncharacterized protein (DUF1330 family)
MGTGHDPSVRAIFFLVGAVLFRLDRLQVAEYIAECARILDKSGLKYQVRGSSVKALSMRRALSLT